MSVVLTFSTLDTPFGSVLDRRCQSSRAPSRGSSLRSAPLAPLDRARELRQTASRGGPVVPGDLGDRGSFEPGGDMPRDGRRAQPRGPGDPMVEPERAARLLRCSGAPTLGAQLREMEAVPEESDATHNKRQVDQEVRTGETRARDAPHTGDRGGQWMSRRSWPAQPPRGAARRGYGSRRRRTHTSSAHQKWGTKRTDPGCRAMASCAFGPAVPWRSRVRGDSSEPAPRAHVSSRAAIVHG